MINVTTNQLKEIKILKVKHLCRHLKSMRRVYRWYRSKTRELNANLTWSLKWCKRCFSSRTRNGPLEPSKLKNLKTKSNKFF